MKATLTILLAAFLFVGCKENPKSKFVAGKCEGCNFTVGSEIDRPKPETKNYRVLAISIDDYFTLTEYLRKYQIATVYNTALTPDERITTQMETDYFLRQLHKRTFAFSQHLPFTELPLNDSTAIFIKPKK